MAWQHGRLARVLGRLLFHAKPVLTCSAGRRVALVSARCESNRKRDPRKKQPRRAACVSVDQRTGWRLPLRRERLRLFC